jgi:hypothetical protein
MKLGSVFLWGKKVVLRVRILRMAVNKSFPLSLNIGHPWSRQSARLFLRPSESGHPHPLNRRRVCSPSPFGSGEGTLACGKGGWGGGRGPNSDEGTDTVVL